MALSTASVYPETCAAAFATAARLGYDAVEVMVWTDPVSQEAGALAALSQLHGIPIVSVHAPTLLLTQRIWGPDPWTKVDNSIALAQEVGASTVVLHPPFRWQKEYAGEFVEGVALREHETGVALAVENMFPWRARQRELEAYLPHWDPVPQAYDNVTLDLSHTSTAGSTRWRWLRRSAHGCATSTSPTGSAGSRTSTSCPAAARSLARRRRCLRCNSSQVRWSSR